MKHLVVGTERQTASDTQGGGGGNSTNDEVQWSHWMAAAQQGDTGAYHSLLADLGRVVERYLRSRFGALEFLEDCVQECLLALHQGRHTFNPQRPFRPWMFAIVRHKAIDMLRKRTVQQRHLDNSLSKEEKEDHFASIADTSNAIEDLMQSKQLFHSLSPSFRQALILTKVLGLTIREAAGKEGVSEVAMKVRVHRAMQELKRDLAMV